MVSEIIVAVCSLLGTAAGSFGGMRLMSYRIEQLEKRVDKHNNVIERVYRLEEKDAIHDEQMRVANHRIADLERREEK
jgi:hypothetical protein